MWLQIRNRLHVEVRKNTLAMNENMPFFITNYSRNFGLSHVAIPIYLHHYKDCEKLNAPYENGEISIPNSGYIEIAFEGKGKRFQILLAIQHFRTCNTCRQRSMIEQHAQFLRTGYSTEEEDPNWIREASEDYDRLKIPWQVGDRVAWKTIFRTHNVIHRGAISCINNNMECTVMSDDDDNFSDLPFHVLIKEL